MVNKMKKVTSGSTLTKHNREGQRNTPHPHNAYTTTYWKRTHTKKEMARAHRTKQTEKENENQRNTKSCVRQSIKKQEKRKNRLKHITNKSVNATGRPTPCGQTPEKTEKHRRTKEKNNQHSARQPKHLSSL
jgi:hypothetical protein